jgi:hypothetical protein
MSFLSAQVMGLSEITLGIFHVLQNLGRRQHTIKASGRDGNFKSRILSDLFWLAFEAV